MFVGALEGAALVLHVHVASLVTIAPLLVVAVAALSYWSGRSNAPWDTGRRARELHDGWERRWALGAGRLSVGRRASGVVP